MADQSMRGGALPESKRLIEKYNRHAEMMLSKLQPEKQSIHELLEKVFFFRFIV